MKKFKFNYFLLFTLTIMGVLYFSSCKKDKQTYLFKGHLYRNADKDPFSNEKFDIYLYRKKKAIEQSKKNHVFEKVLGSLKTDANGYFEFKYEHQSSGVFFTLNHDIVATFQNIDSRTPVNQNVEKDFFPPPSCGIADVYVNTNNKLNSEDTFYIRYEYLCNPLKSQVDTIYGNYNGFFKTINASRVEQENDVYPYDEIVGVSILASKNRHSSSGVINYDYFKIFPINFPLRNNSTSDKIYIEY